jgi:hypothetical protein
MKKYLSLVLVALVLGAIFGSVQAEVPQKTPPMLTHDVYFTLKESTPQARQRLVAACKKYLTGHPGAVRFAVGPIAEEQKQEVNDHNFDVALHLVFKSKAALDQYAKSERHLKFIQESRESWKKVRVFDSYIDE